MPYGKLLQCQCQEELRGKQETDKETNGACKSKEE